jgi:DNA (cytosine-5)-methyltransferase 1
MLTFIDLFCGIGSFHFSLKELGGHCVLACDINESARKTYETNYGLQPLKNVCDIKSTDIPDFDILCGGFPCQSFSNIGQQKGLDDERGSLINQIIRILKDKKPKAFILENVRGLLTHDGGRTFEIIKNMLIEAGYVVQWNILSCDDFGIPQMRKRLFVVGVRDDLQGNISLTLEFLKKPTPTLATFMERDFKRTCAYTIRCGGRMSKIGDKHNWDTYMVGNNEYVLQIPDMKKLQGFPDSFQLVGSKKEQEKLLGNTIPTPLTFAVGKAVIDYLANLSTSS